MSVIEHDFNAVVALLPNRTSADTPRTWTVNGERGYRHGDPHCTKLRRAANVRVRLQRSTPAEEVKNRPCPECFLTSFIRSQPEPRALKALLSIERDLRGIERNIDSENRSLTDVAHAQSQIERTGSALARVSGNHEAMDNYAQAVERMQAQANALKQANHESLLARTGELVHNVAINTMLPDRYGAEQILADDTSWRTLQGDRGSWEMLEVFDTWNKARRTGDTSSETVLAKGRSTFRLTGLVQLDGVQCASALSSNNLIDEVKATWAAHRDNVVRGLIARWDSTLAEYLDMDTPTLAAIRNFESDGLASQVITAYTIYGDQNTQTVVVRAPELVTNWLRVQGQEPSYRQIFAEGNRVHTHPNVENAAVIETAAHLWDPAGKGPYATFAEAMRAAIALAS